jgi:peptidoglycan/LPS O-acetylase OafA/YrhL
MLDSAHGIKPIATRHEQLDGLRALAVFSVFITHWLPVIRVLGFSPGRLGVNLFFVLSGFLITGILLKTRDSIEQGAQPLSRAVGHFYARRALRLLPLIYMVLIITTLLDYPGVRDTVLYHSFYVGNFYFALHSELYNSTSHLWSLAVEEQFYMVWPWVILLVPKRLLLKSVIVVIILAPLFRLLCYELDLPSISIRTLTPSSFDMFGVGALLALIAKREGYEYVANMKIVKWMGVIGLSLLIITATPNIHRVPIIFQVGQSLGSALFFGWLVVHATVGFSGIFGTILASKPMVYTGTISYGLYVVHNFVPHTLQLLFGSDVWSTVTPLAKVVFNMVGTFIIASLSWHFFEGPINRLKKHFPYS